jgi:hypothetical protein
MMRRPMSGSVVVVYIPSQRRDTVETIVLTMVVTRLRVLCNGIAGSAYVGDLRGQMDLAVLIVIAVVGALRNGGERLASLDQISDDRSMGPDAAAAGALGVTLDKTSKMNLYSVAS